jgi:cysteine desulfurase / selenocysteine lyase
VDQAEKKPMDKPDWAEFRRQMPVAQEWAYLDHSAVAPLPEPTRAAIIRWANEAALEGNMRWPAWAAQVEELRQESAALIGAEAAEIALVRNTTTGITLVAEGYPWQPGDNVVTLADEFPSNQYPWINLRDRGVETRRVATDEGRVDLDRVAAACDGRTRILSISWVSYSTGWRNDLERMAEIAHRRGALLFVDAIQGLGVFPLDVRRTPIDFLAADGHKWLLGPEGAGILFVRREHLDRLRATGVGWHSVANKDFTRIEFVLKSTAERFEGGSENMVGMIGLAQSIKLLRSYGAEAIAQRVLAITDLACERLAAIGARIASDRRPEHKSGIVLFDLPGVDPMAMRQHLLEQKVVLSCRAGKLRITPHAYNDASDIERLMAGLRS